MAEFDATTQRPKRIKGDQGEAEFADPIEQDAYLAAKAGAATRNRGMRFSKVIGAGPLSDSQANGTNLADFNRVV